MRKHCRKHHPEWLAELDERTRENNLKHSAASYCSTEPSDPLHKELAAEKVLARKRQRVDGSDSTGTTPRLDPVPAPTIEDAELRGSLLPQILISDEGSPSRDSLLFPRESSWSSFGHEDCSSELRPTSSLQDSLAKPRNFQSCSDAVEPFLESQRSMSIEPVSQNFFILDSSVLAPKRGMSLTSDAMLELAREVENQNRGDGISLSLETYSREDLEDSKDPIDFIGDVFA